MPHVLMSCVYVFLAEFFFFVSGAGIRRIAVRSGWVPDLRGDCAYSYRLKSSLVSCQKTMSLHTWVSGLLGLCFPECQCGIVPVVRRLINKGFPVSCGVTFMLAAPIVNPIVEISAFAAFRGQSPWLNMWTRLVLGYLVSSVAAALTVRQLEPESILREGAMKVPAQKRLAFSRSISLPDAAMSSFKATFPQKLPVPVRIVCRRLHRYGDLF